MRDPRVRAALVGLILALPALMAAINPHRASLREVALPVLAVEAVLAVGLVVALRTRARLECLRTTAPVRPTLAPARHVRPARNVHVGRV